MRNLAIIALATLTACGPDLSALEGRDAISFGVYGSIHGGGSTTLYDTDQVVADWWGGDPGPEGPRLTPVPAGTFAALVPVALDGIAELRPYDGELCMDYGTDYIRVTLDGVVTEATAICPVDELLTLRHELAAAMGQ